MWVRGVLKIAVWSAFGVSCRDAPPPPPLTAAAHRADVEAWRAYRYDLLDREGWLALTGLHWLNDGVSTMGRGADADIVAGGPDTPGSVGSFTAHGDSVTWRSAPGVPVTVRGVPVATMRVRTDDRPDTTVFHLGSHQWYVIQRGERFAVRTLDTLAPQRVDFTGIAAFPVDTAWRIVGRFDRYDPPKPIAVPNVLGTVDQRNSPGAAVFTIAGRRYRLDVVGDPAADRFWIQFGDHSNGHETYGAGRYLWIDAPDEHGYLVLDFNQAYNPPCVFTPYATCPLPPKQNELPVRIPAGELSYAPAGR